MAVLADEYPPLKGSPGAVVYTKPQHLVTEIHLNEETGWVWRSGWEAWLPRPAGRRGGPRLVRQLEADTCGQAALWPKMRYHARRPGRPLQTIMNC